MRARRALLASWILVGAVLAGCGEETKDSGVSTVLDREPDQITEIVAVARDGRRAQLTREREGTWAPRGATAAETASIMYAAQDRMFPLLAYRELHVDPANPEFGLDDPELVLSARDRAGRSYRVALGAGTFNDEGYYARTSTGRRDAVYLVPRSIALDLRSLVSGRVAEYNHPVDEKMDAIAERAEQAPKKPDEWLSQALDHGAVLPGGLE